MEKKPEHPKSNYALPFNCPKGNVIMNSSTLTENITMETENLWVNWQLWGFNITGTIFTSTPRTFTAEKGQKR